MPGKPAIFPANQHAIDEWATQAQDHLPPAAWDLEAALAAKSPDVSDPPGSLFNPYATVNLPDAGADGIEAHAHLPDHISDWLLA